MARVLREEGGVKCPMCGYLFPMLTPILDHHVLPCSGCGGSLFVYSFDEQHVCVAVDVAPPVVARFLTWANDTLDELEFVELTVLLPEVLGLRMTSTD